jgi:transcription elongation regulator 1
MSMPYYPGPPAMPNFPPPLPAGWSEHNAPDGVTKYYYNSNTKESTYTRPSFAPLPNVGASASGSASAESKEKKKKKEKPKDKVPVPGTTWTRVTTSEGNVFYFEKESKRSEWTIPEEIKDAVAELEKAEQEEKDRVEREKREKEEEERIERIKERERIRLQVEEEREKKRKAREENGEDERETKVAKKDKEADYEPEGEDDEEAWAKAVAAEFAEQDAATKAKEEEDKAKAEREEQEAAKKVFAAPGKVNVTVAEGRALFKVSYDMDYRVLTKLIEQGLLIERDISPFAPWDQSLPLFINDPRYILLGTMKDRQEVFDEYCRDIGRQRRLGKNAPAGSRTETKKADPEREYKALLREEVTSTRTRWDDFRKKFKKDRRFYSYGRDDRDREKMFKTHLRELGEREFMSR